MTVRQLLHRAFIVFGAIEIVGAFMGAGGIAVEVIYEADIGFILITGGAVLFGIGSGLWAKVYVGSR